VRSEAEKTCYCKTCDKYFHPLGIMGHRKSHRTRREDVTIEFTYGNVRTWRYSELPPHATREQAKEAEK